MEILVVHHAASLGGALGTSGLGWEYPRGSELHLACRHGKLPPSSLTAWAAQGGAAAVPAVGQGGRVALLSSWTRGTVCWQFCGDLG